MNHLNRALLTTLSLSLVVVAIWQWNAQAQGAAPTIASPVYLPFLACAGCTGAPLPTLTPDTSELVSEAARLINSERIAAGCPAAVVTPQLMAATKAWSQYMADRAYYHHAETSWYARYGYLSGVLENIGIASQPSQIISYWLESTAGHRENLLECSYSISGTPDYDPTVTYDMGVGYARGYWTFGITAVWP